MENDRNINYKAIAGLKLSDLKAQKKTVALKKLCNIPLSYEEVLKENFEVSGLKNLKSFE